jgi:cellulose synthase/poly-beta-1,6-N-acetylglucosamine synthase-like glycosyltransferase
MSSVFIFIVLIILSVYVIMQAVCAFAWLTDPTLKLQEAGGNPSLTVLIAFRNEAHNLGVCIQGILNQNYPSENVKILLLNDHSDDNSVKSISAYLQFPNVRLLEMPAHIQGKKQSIAFGLNEVHTAFVLFTDADCVAGPDWVRQMMETIISSDADAICGPVAIHKESNLLEQFQALDFAGMMAITAVSMKFKWFYLANGANMLVRMEALDINNISWQEEYASGDDMSLISHLQKKHSKIQFAKNKNAIVSTMAHSNLSSFFQQRLRWGTKNKSSKSMLMLFQLGIAYLVSVFSILAFIGMFFQPKFLYIILLKLLGDAILLASVAPYFRKQTLLIKIPVFSIMHSTYIAVIGTLSLLPLRYQWKGRFVK